MHRRFNMLRVLSAVYKLIGALVGILAIAAFAFALYVALARPDAFYPTNVADAYLYILGTGTTALLVGLLLSLMLFGAGVLLDVYMGIEENTRATSIYLRRIWQRDQNRRREGPPSQPISRPIQAPPASRPIPTPPQSRPVSTLPPPPPVNRAPAREPHAVQMLTDAPPAAAPAPLPSAPVAPVTLPAMAEPAPATSTNTPQTMDPADITQVDGANAGTNHKDGATATPVRPDDGPPAFILDNPPAAMRGPKK